MKNLILLLIALSTTISVVGQNNNNTKEVDKSYEAATDENIKNLSQMICNFYVGDNTQIAAKTRLAIENFLKEKEKIENPSTSDIIRFLNRNKHFMTCGEENMNYLMVSFDHGNAFEQLFDDLFLDDLLLDDGPYIDINAISNTGKNNSPETVLDYVLQKYKSPSTNETTRRYIKDLIDIFEESLNGKRYDELSEAEKQEFLNIKWDE